MRGEDQLDVEFLQRLLNLFGIQPRRFQLLNRSPDGFTDRIGIPLLFALPQHANPLPIFGEVCEVEKDTQ